MCEVLLCDVDEDFNVTHGNWSSDGEKLHVVCEESYVLPTGDSSTLLPCVDGQWHNGTNGTSLEDARVCKRRVWDRQK